MGKEEQESVIWPRRSADRSRCQVFWVNCLSAPLAIGPRRMIAERLNAGSNLLLAYSTS